MFSRSIVKVKIVVREDLEIIEEKACITRIVQTNICFCQYEIWRGEMEPKLFSSIVAYNVEL